MKEWEESNRVSVVERDTGDPWGHLSLNKSSSPFEPRESLPDGVREKGLRPLRREIFGSLEVCRKTKDLGKEDRHEPEEE